MVPDDDMKELRNRLRGQSPIDEIIERASQRTALIYSVALVGIFLVVIVVSLILDRFG